MGNIKKFNEFNSVNEGLISWASKKINPGELDDLVKNIIENIKSNFSYDNLEFEPTNNNDTSPRTNKFNNTYSYKLNDDVIMVKKTLGGENFSLIINDDYVGRFVNTYYIKDLFHYLSDKYKNKDIEMKRRSVLNDVSTLRGKLSKYDNIRSKNGL